MNDLISRRLAIETIVNTPSQVQDKQISLTDQYDGATFRQIEILGMLDTLPPARQWIPIKKRPMDEEEKRYWEEHYAYKFGEDYDGIMFDCPMPEDGQEVWVCSKCGNVWQDTCEVDIGIGLEGNGDWDDIVAWMPFERPEPWKGEYND